MTDIPRDVFEKEKRFTQRMNEEEQRNFHHLKTKLKVTANATAVNRAVGLALKFLKLRGDTIERIKKDMEYYEIYGGEL